MKKFKKLSAVLSVILCMSMLMGMGTVFATEGVEPYGGIYEDTFSGGTKRYGTNQPIAIHLSNTGGTKQIGSVYIWGDVTWDEIWEVDQNGNKIRFVRSVNPRFLSADTDYTLVPNASISNEVISLDGSTLIIQGWGRYVLADFEFNDEYYAALHANSFV